MSEQILERPSTTAPGGVLPGIESDGPAKSSRNRTFLLVGLAIVGGLILGGVLLFVLRSGSEDEGDPVAAAAAAAAWAAAQAKAEAAAEAAAASAETTASRTKVKITSRDPFAPLVTKPEPAAQASDPDAGSSSSSSSSSTGATISALSISGSGDSVKLKLDGKKYSVDEGETFAKSYRLYDVFNDNCAGFLYGDQNVVVCEGDSVTIG